jgi:site-specific recombinase XerD
MFAVNNYVCGASVMRKTYLLWNMPRGKGITTAIYFNKYKPQKDGKCPVSIRITYNREKKFYDTGKRLTPTEYAKLYSVKPRLEEKILLSSLKHLEEKAQRIIDGLGDSFSFSTFDKLFLTNKAVIDLLFSAFDEYIDTIESSRVGTITSYQTARNSFHQFKHKAKISDVNVSFLKDYEAWMISKGRSITSVAIYCRSLRSVLNYLISEGKLNVGLYPFGSAKVRKYEIPVSRNIKKALSLEEIGKIFHYPCEADSTSEMCRDYWIFLYLANGINVKDFCLLKWKNIDGDMLSFIREKTVRTKKQIEAIQVVIQPAMKKIIGRWGTKTINKEGFIFPHLTNISDAKAIRDKVQLLTSLVNDHMKGIAAIIGIEKDVTTYFARHSFATIMKNSGAPIAMISQALGHSSMVTTQNYLASFETEQLKAATSALTAFK